MAKYGTVEYGTGILYESNAVFSADFSGHSSAEGDINVERALGAGLEGNSQVTGNFDLIRLFRSVLRAHGLMESNIVFIPEKPDWIGRNNPVSLDWKER